MCLAVPYGTPAVSLHEFEMAGEVAELVLRSVPVSSQALRKTYELRAERSSLGRIQLSLVALQTALSSPRHPRGWVICSGGSLWFEGTSCQNANSIFFMPQFCEPLLQLSWKKKVHYSFQQVYHESVLRSGFTLFHFSVCLLLKRFKQIAPTN